MPYCPCYGGPAYVSVAHLGLSEIELGPLEQARLSPRIARTSKPKSGFICDVSDLSRDIQTVIFTIQAVMHDPDVSSYSRLTRMPRPSSGALRSASGLPPLPPPPSWRTYFPPRQLAAPPDKMCREFPGRVLLASPDLCDDFVRALHLRENEVVLEYNPGPGQLTRSLLSGGSKEARAWSHERLAEAQAIPSAQESSASDESLLSGSSKQGH